ncbi:hypothetical protein [Salibaculum halophilum]|uniref:hypothetical protein n=1 Tax=Salibaculum halophilum TaxID=1914408 RepID=UPI00117AFA23|nr:hypothetical protein [Salibaculum halophilum]
MDRLQTQALARDAILTGDPGLARQLALALLEADDSDRVAQLILAAAEPQLGRPRAGRKAGTHAWRLSRSDPQKYEAARLTALAARQADQDLLAMYWLRRALTVSPTPTDHARTRNDVRRVRAESRTRLRLGFGLMPSSNVNGGAEDRLNIVEGVPVVGILSEDAVAQPGLIASADLRLSYRMDATSTALTRVDARLFQTAVWLDEPDTDLRGRDFAQTYLEFGLTHARRVSGGMLDASVRVGRQWQAMSQEGDLVGAELGFGWPGPGGKSDFRIKADLEQYWPATGADERLDWTLGLTGRTERAGGGDVSWGLSAGGTASASRNIRRSTLSLRVGYEVPDRIGPADLALHGRLAYRDYPDYTLLFAVPGGRQDVSMTGTISATFTDFSYAGFAPTASLSVTQTDSNVSRFDTEATSLRIGFRSAF